MKYILCKNHTSVDQFTDGFSFRYVINLDKMVRKKIDNRVRLLIENGVAEGKRSMFVVVGDKARDQVGVLQYIFLRAFFW